MSLKIDRMRLQLPAGFEHRAADIARLLGERLAQGKDLPGGHLDHVQIKHTLNNNSLDNQALANELALQIQQQVRKQR